MGANAAVAVDSRPVDPSWKGIPDEARFVMLSAGRDDDAARARMAPLAGRLRWPLVLLLAQRERAVVRLHRLTGGAAGMDVPADVRSHLGRQALVVSFAMRQLESRVDRLLATFEAEGIDALLLKGAALRSWVFEGFEDRPMSDVDILVRPDQAARAQEIALCSGWVRSRRALPDAFYEHHHHLAPLEAADGVRVSLEIHKALTGRDSPITLDPAEFWKRSVPVSGTPRPGGAGAVHPEDGLTGAGRVPAPEHLMLHACVHLAWSHSLGSGAWRTFRDVSALAALPFFDWDAFFDAARRARAQRCVYWTFRLAAELADLEELPDLPEDFEPRQPEGLKSRLTRHFAAQLAGSLPHGFPVRVREALWRMAVHPGGALERAIQSGGWAARSSSSRSRSIRTRLLRQHAEVLAREGQAGVAVPRLPVWTRAWRMLVHFGWLARSP